ncbi:unnamed protein product [Bursaphelenchus xylophilus]|uniref:(pine wood nematode) hypothetical protein n=1 Tax=Bursaphelenchus xylophilus TaxID=6326 RepID=A0A1I7SVN3_BURXY|nr:unnamed protein product [Bursaphelenchus xylophilus]CAG9097990.1 unnamed protein product [Bursaphelenchus xylophilus]
MILEIIFFSGFFSVCYLIDEERRRFGKSRVPILCGIFDQIRVQSVSQTLLSSEGIDKTIDETVSQDQKIRKKGKKRSAGVKSSPCLSASTETLREERTQRNAIVSRKADSNSEKPRNL